MPTTTIKRALVLSGGGFAGGAWMLGLIHTLREGGVDLGDADLVVGTSAGARTGAQLATGVLDEVVAMNRHAAALQIQGAAKLEEFLAASMRIIGEVGDGQQAARRIANLEPLGPGLVSEAERRRVIASHLPVQAWPAQRLVVTAVEADSGSRVTFDADSGVGLLDAVTASGALPGIFPLATINGRRYADGGVHSLYNADLAAGHDIVVVVSPMPLDGYLQGKLDAEVAVLGEATVRVILADEASLATIGPNPLSADTERVVNAGAAQAQREIDAVRSAWPAR
jgi:NTE family protein